MFPNAKGSEQLSLLATIDPVSQAAGAISSAWVPAVNFHNFLALIQTGVLGTAATLDAKLSQAQDNTGTGVKDITAKTITQIVKATGDNKQALINFRPDDLDANNGFAFVRLTLTVGTAASIVAAQLFGIDPRYATADAYNQAAVAQIV